MTSTEGAQYLGIVFLAHTSEHGTPALWMLVAFVMRQQGLEGHRASLTLPNPMCLQRHPA